MNTTSKTPVSICLKDYKTPAYLVEQVELNFNLLDSATQVSSILQMSLNPDRKGVTEPLILDGEQLILLEIKLDDKALTSSDYLQCDESLQINRVSEKFTLEIQTQIDPLNNTALEGLYLTSGNFCTQCEAQGFRRMTYYPDRPDVLAMFRVRIEADQKYSVLLSNGNLLEQGDLRNGRHFAVWEDPFLKPSYLFALVAGDLVCLEDHYTTTSGRDVLLQIYVEDRNSDYCDHAMLSLKKSMQWDEEAFGLEYDLDRYMIVAVDDFNMGAMENKGLNVFNSKYVLAHPDTATDTDYLGVESVIGHEYFHNWTGNRVTCRDWFQLSLKEGLTVFRDQQFSAEMNSAAVKRIDDVRVLRQYQFPEDAGPMSHPVRPAYYLEINNFYTTTIYNKGAEVIRMMQTLLGEEKFVAGVQLYLKRHDGQAATCDDFVVAMEEAGSIDLTTFKRWYSQAGTPQLQIVQSYDASRQSLTLEISQSCPSAPDRKERRPFHIPIAVGLLDGSGKDISLQFSGELRSGATTRVLELTEQTQKFTFVGLEKQPTLSPLREFSAPVRLQCDFTDEELAFRMAHDSDSFNRWEAGQTLAMNELLRMYHDLEMGEAFSLQSIFVDAWKKALTDRQADKSLLTQLLTLPSEQYLADQLSEYNPQAIRDVRDQAIRQLASDGQTLLAERYGECFSSETAYSLDPVAVGQRSLANFSLSILMRLEQQNSELCLHQYSTATNMTDRLAAFTLLVDSNGEERQGIIDEYYQQWKKHPLLLDKWFSILALSHRADTFSEVENLIQHPEFTLSNPNRVRALLGAFYQNLAVFHRDDGAGYQLLVEQIMQLDQRNPQVAARMAAPLTRWKRLEPIRRELMRQELLRLQQSDLSRDLYEIINKSLQ